MKVMRVIEAFSCDIDGVPRVYTEGMLVKSTDPVCKGRDRFLMDAEVYTDRSLGNSDATEAATAAPGEKRSLWAKKSASRAQKRAEAANPTGADDGEADPESGSNQVPGVNNKNAPDTEDSETPAAVQKLAEEVNRTGADDGEADPESGASQVPGVNDDPSAKPGDGYDDGMSGTADDGGPTGGITTDDVEPVPPKPTKKAAAKKAAKKAPAKKD